MTDSKKKLYIIWGEKIVEKINYIFLIKENELKKREKNVKDVKIWIVDENLMKDRKKKITCGSEIMVLLKK